MNLIFWHTCFQYVVFLSLTVFRGPGRSRCISFNYDHDGLEFTLVLSCLNEMECGVEWGLPHRLAWWGGRGEASRIIYVSTLSVRTSTSTSKGVGFCSFILPSSSSLALSLYYYYYYFVVLFLDHRMLVRATLSFLLAC